MAKEKSVNGGRRKGSVLAHQHEGVGKGAKSLNGKEYNLETPGAFPQEGVGYTTPPEYRYHRFGHGYGNPPAYNQYLVALDGARDGFLDAAYGRSYAPLQARAAAESKYGAGAVDDYSCGYDRGYSDYRSKYGAPLYGAPGYGQAHYNESYDPGRGTGQAVYGSPGGSYAR